MSDLSKELTAEMLPDNLWRQIAEAIGVEALYKLAQEVGGATIYVPKPESLVRPVRDAKIKEEFNGYNHLALAKKYDVTERWVRQICGEGHLEDQIGLFDLIDGSNPIEQNSHS